MRPISQRLTVSAYLAKWLTGVKATKRPRTYESYAETVRLYIEPAIGKVPLVKLEPEHVQSMLSRLNGKRGNFLSPTTQRYVYTVLRIALGRALKQGRVVRNVCTLLDAPPKVRHESKPLSRAEITELIAGLRGDPFEALIVTALGTGLRQGELLALRWDDVDLERGELVVRHTLQRGTLKLAQPKTERARRMLRLPRRVTSALREHRAQQTVVPLSGLIFATNDGKPLHSRSVTQRLQRILRRLGLPRQRFHDLRHAFATVMIESGEDLSVLSRILGHADLSTTADVYAHLTPAMLDRAAERIDGVLGDALAQ